MPVWQIFMGTLPMTFTMLIVLILTVLFPQLALWIVGVNWSWW
jgi:TRAP-type C4-dicarboxylate transport system permease large subunit